MKLRYAFLLLLVFIIGIDNNLHAQQPAFTSDPSSFVKELETFLKASGKKELDDLFKDFEKRVKQGVITPDQLLLLHEQAVLMRETGMTASPYFESWLSVMDGIIKGGISADRFAEWLNVYTEELKSIEKRKLKPVKDFLEFSEGFFTKSALRYSSSGVSWYADPRKGRFGRDTQGLVLIFDPVELMAQRKLDSIVIQNTTGRYYPALSTWQGQGGLINWSRFDNTEIKANLKAYSIDFTQSIYTADNVELTYPLLFGDRQIQGQLTDKLVVRNQAVEGSYPKFESYEKIIEIANIGGGVKYKGGFRLEGTSIYGFAGEENQALITLTRPDGRLQFKATSDLFTIKREEQVTGSRVETTIYFGDDSLFHQSVDFRFEIDKRIMRLNRSNRASDKAPYYSSMHKFDFDVDGVTWYLDRDTIKLGERSIAGTKGKDEMQVISEDFFNDNDYRKIQNISDVNPLSLFKKHVDETGQRTFSASTLAYLINPDFSVENIQTLLFDLVQRGFIFYDFEKNLVEIKPKLDHYVLSSQNKRDHDFLNVMSTTRQDNGVLSLKDSTITLNGVPFVEFSQPQQVAVLPENQRITVGKNRDIDFSGKVFAGTSVIQGNAMFFKYPKFNIRMDTIKTFDLFIPTGLVDSLEKPISLAIDSRIENFAGVLQIDAPENKSGKKDIPLFPSIQSTTKSYVYYDRPDIQDGVYLRDSFYFQIDPFTFNSLDKFTGDALKFRGRLVSDSIFPTIEETVYLMPDSSLGFVHKTPASGLGTYVDRGKYTGEISLSNIGLEGKGLIQYLRAKAFSEDVIFRPEQMTGSAQQFDITEDRKGPIYMPKVEGSNVLINWRPYQDSMYVTTQDKAFDFYPEKTHTLTGMLILTPDGLRGRGTFDWDKGFMESQLLAFGAHDVTSDTLDLKIRALGSTDLAFDTRNVNGIADFDKQIGKFRANSENLSTVMPYNRYQTSMNEFEWDMEKESITFKSDPGKMAEFLCTDPVQDSLQYQGKTAFYDLKTNLLRIGGVPQIFSADAWIYPGDGNIEVKAGGVITTLQNAKIIADTSNKYHVINRATVDIFGRRHYEAKGFYEYNVGIHQQEIAFDSITGYPVRKGEFSEKRSVTRAQGVVTEDNQFFVDHKTRFQGTIVLEADSPELRFDGFAFLDADRLNQKGWFSIDSKADKKNLVLRYNRSRNLDGELVKTGFFINKSTSILYPTVMTMPFLRKDRPLIEAEGMFRYDLPADSYYFGDSSKVVGTGRRGSLVVFSNKTGSIYGEGKLSFGSGLDMVKIDAAGTINSPFNVPDSLYYGEGVPPPKVTIEAMAGLELLLPEALMKVMVNDMNRAFDGTFIDYLSDPFYERYLSEFIPDDAKYAEVTNIMKNRALALPEEFKKYPFFLPKVSLVWNPDLQSFVSDGDKLAMTSINGEVVNRYVSGHLEIRMPSNEDDRLYIYLKSGSEFFYFFGYRGGITSITSNNPEFMDAAAKLKAKELVIKLPGDKVYEIQFVGPETAELWLRRIQSPGK
ncbi:MAG: hypothetical protein KA479_01880 [Saprospiraceae bacterium]|nr:hypothetical protein [Saprospiraceae bacterium]